MAAMGEGSAGSSKQVMLSPFTIGLLVFQCFSMFLGFLLVFFLFTLALKKLFALCTFILVFFSA